MDASSDQDSKSKSTPKKKIVSKEAEKSTRLRKVYKRKYALCVKQIKELTSKDLPRKARKSMTKVSVNIPVGKEIGDEITFE